MCVRPTCRQPILSVVILYSTGQGPDCGCTPINSTNVQLSCSVTFGDSDFNKIYPNFTWTSNGNYYTSNVGPRTRTNEVFVSTSSITISANDQTTYQCTLTFTPPDPTQFPYVATNAPVFSKSCTSPCESQLRIYPQNLRTLAINIYSVPLQLQFGHPQLPLSHR